MDKPVTGLLIKKAGTFDNVFESCYILLPF